MSSDPAVPTPATAAVGVSRPVEAGSDAAALDTAALDAGSPGGTQPVQVGDRAPLPPGPLPKGVAASGWLGLLLALALVVIGMIAIYDAVIGWRLTTGTQPSSWLADRLGTVTPGPVVIAVSIALLLLGLLLLVFGLKGRPHRVYRVEALTGVYLRLADAARLIERDLFLLPGVAGARAKAGAGKVVVRVETTGAEETPAAVRAAVERRISCLKPKPTVKYKLSVAQHRGEVRS